MLLKNMFGFWTRDQSRIISCLYIYIKAPITFRNVIHWKLFNGHIYTCLKAVFPDHPQTSVVQGFTAKSMQPISSQSWEVRHYFKKQTVALDYTSCETARYKFHNNFRNASLLPKVSIVSKSACFIPGSFRTNLGISHNIRFIVIFKADFHCLPEESDDSHHFPVARWGTPWQSLLGYSWHLTEGGDQECLAPFFGGEMLTQTSGRSQIMLMKWCTFNTANFADHWLATFR